MRVYRNGFWVKAWDLKNVPDDPISHCLNSSYWGKALTKLSSLTSTVYNFNNNGSKTEESGIKVFTKQARHIGRWSCCHAYHVRQETQDMLAREHRSTQGTLARELVSTKDKLAYWARKHGPVQGPVCSIKVIELCKDGTLVKYMKNSDSSHWYRIA